MTLTLCYHAVSPTWQHRLSVPPQALERQLHLLGRLGYRGGTVEQAVRRRGRLVHVTFDDAYRSVAHALPILERLGVPATIFACTAAPGRTLRIAELAAEAEAQPAELETMPWDELRACAERGVEIGAHTVNHPHLTQLGDGELRRELVDSKEAIESELGRRCDYLAYPFGDEDARVHAAARAAGYRAAFALPGNEERSDEFAVPRVGVYPRDGLVRFAVKTTGAVRRPVAALLRATGRRT